MAANIWVLHLQFVSARRKTSKMTVSSCAIILESGHLKQKQKNNELETKEQIIHPIFYSCRLNTNSLWYSHPSRTFPIYTTYTSCILCLLIILHVIILYSPIWWSRTFVHKCFIFFSQAYSLNFFYSFLNLSLFLFNVFVHYLLTFLILR